MNRQPDLQTPRLHLRPFQRDDASWVQQLAGDERVADVTASIPHPYPLEAAEAWIATHEQEWAGGSGIIYAIIGKADGVPVGTVSITNIGRGSGELGYWLGVPYWGLGYCTEAARALVRFAAQSCGVRELSARHVTRNPASGRVLRKVGFVHRDQSVAACGYRQNVEPIENYVLETRNIVDI
ncbi:GNAT family N-acetyltransferase [Arhodomonas sp. AD133]|uniref:GNAT family N-acetyltransferase n=1 Tax=Arhodomonas sp. AD133 TaxID=3415009 RepID=UPI003EB7456B